MLKGFIGFISGVVPESVVTLPTVPPFEVPNSSSVVVELKLLTSEQSEKELTLTEVGNEFTIQGSCTYERLIGSFYAASNQIEHSFSDLN